MIRIGSALERWPFAADAALTVVAFLASVLVYARNGEDSYLRTFGDVPVGGYLVFAVAAAVLLARRQQPVVVFVVVLACSALAITFDYGHVGVGMLVSVYTVARYTESKLASRGVLLAAVGFATVDAIAADATAADLGGGVLVTFLVWFAALRVRERGEGAALLLREQSAQESRVLAEERSRIARELHDVVAHGVSLMTVQAGAARTVAATDPQSAIQAMAAVEQAGRQALGELRHLLAVLRPDSSGGELGPQPGLSDVDRLVAQFRDAGLEVALTIDPTPAGLPARVDLFAYRIVQEAMTNALKHAGSGTSVEVTISVDGGAIRVSVVDDGSGTQRLPGTGHGLIGMRERVQLLHGTFRAGPRTGGGFEVVAVLPTGDAS